MANQVYDDYQRRQFTSYFTANFVHKHLRPFVPVPLGDFAANRSRAREGNVSLVQRNQHFESVAQNSLIFDFDPQHRVKQILLLMQEVAGRNAGGDYARQPGKVLVTADEYYVQTTQPGSRNDFVRGCLAYKVANVNGRFVINHLEGISR
jgi:hypothetical protein